METICLDAKNRTCVMQVSAPVAKRCLGRAGSRVLAAVLRLQDGGLKPCDVSRQWTSIAGILTRISFAQSEREGRSGLPFTHRFELGVFMGE